MTHRPDPGFEQGYLYYCTTCREAFQLPVGVDFADGADAYCSERCLRIAKGTEVDG